MYGKVFSQMYDGTLGTKGPWQALVAFQQLIILADKEGVVDMTPDALARRTTIPLAIIELGIATLELPDPDSRSPDEEGRRIVRLSDDRSWGWRIVNYEHYRKLRSEEERREYHKLYARKRRASTKRQQVNTESTESTKAVSSMQEAKGGGKRPPKGTGALVTQIRNLAEQSDSPAHGVQRFIRREKVEALGADVLQAYEAVGGMKRFLEAEGRERSFLNSEFARELDAARQP